MRKKIDMTRFLIVFYLLVTPVLYAGAIESLEMLVAATRQQLEWQEELLLHTQQFEVLRTSFIESQDDPVLGTRMVRQAMRIHDLIEQAHLAHVFSEDFLEEISFFHDLGTLHRIHA